jgi:hypothetical protein
LRCCGDVQDLGLPNVIFAVDGIKAKTTIVSLNIKRFSGDRDPTHCFGNMPSEVSINYT